MKSKLKLPTHPFTHRASDLTTTALYLHAQGKHEQLGRFLATCPHVAAEYLEIAVRQSITVSLLIGVATMNAKSPWGLFPTALALVVFVTLVHPALRAYRVITSLAVIPLVEQSEVPDFLRREAQAQGDSDG